MLRLAPVRRLGLNGSPLQPLVKLWFSIMAVLIYMSSHSVLGSPFPWSTPELASPVFGDGVSSLVEAAAPVPLLCTSLMMSDAEHL